MMNYLRQREDELKKLRDEVSKKLQSRAADISAIAQKLFTRIISIEE